jgi:catechol 2,3-dioxygenase-like lactoylglutathione lyase family enzyme
VTLVKVRRLLHGNYNCVDLDVLERWYTEVFSLRTVMRSEAPDADGTAFGLEMTVAHRAAFLYDHRGARRAPSLEMVQWLSPPTIGRPYPYPWDHGIQAAGFSAPDLDVAERKARALGGAVVRRDADCLLLRDPEGLPVEVVLDDAQPPEHRHLRVVVHDLAETTGWWGRLGFQPAPDAVRVGADRIWTGAGEHAVEAEVALVAADDPSFSIRFTTWSGPPPVGPTYGAPFHQGLYRMAMAVDDVHAAWKTLRDAGMAIQPPYTFPLPGTKITEGLPILFLRDPDAILVELVERPPSHFR